MATLTGQAIQASYEQLLSLPDGGGNTTTLVAITDGDAGTTFCLQLSTTKAMIEGSGSKLFFSDEGGEHISGNGSILSIAGGTEIDLTATTIDINGNVDISGNIVMADDTSIGIGDSAERIEFDGAGDISFLGCNVGIGLSDPDTALEILSTSAQLQLSYDGSNLARFHVAADAELTIITVDPDGAEGHILLVPDGNVAISGGDMGVKLGVYGSFSTGLVTIAATDAITAAEHAGRTNLLGEVGGNALVTLTLPDATGTGHVYKFIVSVVNTSSYKFVVPDANNTIDGQIMITDNDSDVPNVYHTVAATDTIILNGTTTGGGQIGDYIELTDIAADQWAVNGMVTCPAGSNDATMFSATVS